MIEIALLRAAHESLKSLTAQLHQPLFLLRRECIAVESVGFVSITLHNSTVSEYATNHVVRNLGVVFDLALVVSE